MLDGVHAIRRQRTAAGPASRPVAPRARQLPAAWRAAARGRMMALAATATRRLRGPVTPTGEPRARTAEPHVALGSAPRAAGRARILR